MPEDIQNQDVKLARAKLAPAQAGGEGDIEESIDTISQLFEDRDRSNTEESKDEKTPAIQESETRGSETANVEKAKPSEKKSDLDDGEDAPPSEQVRLDVEILRKKLEKTEKTLAENQRYGRNNAQKVKNALKIAQKLTDEGLLVEEEVKELLGALHSEKEEEPEDEGAYRSSAHPFAPIFKAANKELQNILKYTDDELLQDKVNAFDYFLSVAPKEELEEVLEDLTELLDNPLKLARKMLSIGQEVFEESYKDIKEAGGFKNYLSQKNQELEKQQKKIDKLEKKLAQYEDFDKPRYRMDEMGDSDDGKKPVKDTISALFDERDRVRRK